MAAKTGGNTDFLMLFAFLFVFCFVVSKNYINFVAVTSK